METSEIARRLNTDEPIEGTMSDNERRLKVDLERLQKKLDESEKKATEFRQMYYKQEVAVKELQDEKQKLLTDLHRNDTELEYFRSRTSMLERENNSLRLDNEQLSIRCREHEGYIRGTEISWHKIGGAE